MKAKTNLKTLAKIGSLNKLNFLSFLPRCICKWLIDLREFQSCLLARVNALVIAFLSKLGFCICRSQICSSFGVREFFRMESVFPIRPVDFSFELLFINFIKSGQVIKKLLAYNWHQPALFRIDIRLAFESLFLSFDFL